MDYLKRLIRVSLTPRGMGTGLLFGLALALSACGPFVSPAPLPVASGLTTFTDAAIQNCTSVKWTEKLTDSAGKDVTSEYNYRYSNFTSSSPKADDSLAQLNVNKPGDYSINPDVRTTIVVKISNTYVCIKDNFTLTVDQILVNGTAKPVTIDFLTKLISK